MKTILFYIVFIATTLIVGSAFAGCQAEKRNWSKCVDGDLHKYDSSREYEHEIIKDYCKGTKDV